MSNDENNLKNHSNNENNSYKIEYHSNEKIIYMNEHKITNLMKTNKK